MTDTCAKHTILYTLYTYYVLTRSSTFVHMYACVCTLCVHLFVYIYIYMYACVYVFMNVFYTRMYVRIICMLYLRSVQIGTHRTYKHTHAYTRICLCIFVLYSSSLVFSTTVLENVRSSFQTKVSWLSSLRSLTSLSLQNCQHGLVLFSRFYSLVATGRALSLTRVYIQSNYPMLPLVDLSRS